MAAGAASVDSAGRQADYRERIAAGRERYGVAG
jgi:hypothetical protein